MSPFGTVIGLEKGVMDDMFFLSFERIGTNSYDPPPPPMPMPPAPVALAAGIGRRPAHVR